MIRAVIPAGFALASGALACPLQTGAISLVSETDTAPSAYVEIDTPPLSEPFAMTITFCDPTLDPAALAFDAVMPAHRHGMNYTVDVNRFQENRFEVSNVVFHMVGLWEIQIEAEFAGKIYTYKAEISVK